MRGDAVMDEIRCKECGKLLCKLWGTVEVKCPRCKTMNEVSKGLFDNKKREAPEAPDH